jgi:hypothetical protein
MKSVGLPFSGDIGFVETEMYWPVNHMVAPKEQAVGVPNAIPVTTGGLPASMASICPAAIATNTSMVLATCCS